MKEIGLEQVTFWGLSFRSASHMHWFQMSVVVFALSVLSLLVWFFFFRKSNDFLICPFVMWQLGFAIHVLQPPIALIVTRGGTVNGPIYSVDCIWFNALMACIYFLGWRRLWKRLGINKLSDRG